MQWCQTLEALPPSPLCALMKECLDPEVNLLLPVSLSLHLQNSNRTRKFLIMRMVLFWIHKRNWNLLHTKADGFEFVLLVSIYTKSVYNDFSKLKSVTMFITKRPPARTWVNNINNRWKTLIVTLEVNKEECVPCSDSQTYQWAIVQHIVRYPCITTSPLLGKQTGFQAYVT